MINIEKIGQIHELALHTIAHNYAPILRYRRNPYCPQTSFDNYGLHLVKLGKEIEQFDTSRIASLKKLLDPVLTKFNPIEAKKLAVIKFAPISVGDLYVLPALIENDEEKNVFYQKLKRKIVKFALTFAVIEVMNAQIGKKSPVFSTWVNEIRKASLKMNYSDFAEFLTSFFDKYPKPTDYLKEYTKRTGDEDILKFSSYDNVQRIVDEELISRYKQLEKYETPEAALVNLLDSVLSDDEMIVRALEGVNKGEVKKSICDVKKDPEGEKLIREIAERLHIQHDQIPRETSKSSFFDGTVSTLIADTLGRYREVTGIQVD